MHQLIKLVRTYRVTTGLVERVRLAEDTAVLTITGAAPNPPGPNFAEVDDIVFSAQPVPEPGALVLLVASGVFLAARFYSKPGSEAHLDLGPSNFIVTSTGAPGGGTFSLRAVQPSFSS